VNQYLYLPFHSYHEHKKKTEFIKGEAIRYVRACSSIKEFDQMISLFTVYLQRRGHP
ncbi:hypothetical protein BT69DRAFT_1189816, partial [Atractiella rhizophila]